MGITVNRCCGWSLRKLGSVIGWSYITIFILGISLAILRICFANYDEGRICLKDLKPIDLLVSHFLDEDIWHLMIYSIGLLLNALLLFGIKKTNHYVLLPWLVLKGLTMLMSTPVFILTYVGLFVNVFKIEFLLLFLLIAVFYVLAWWSWIVIFSLYNEIRKESKTKHLDSQSIKNPNATFNRI